MFAFDRKGTIDDETKILICGHCLEPCSMQKEEKTAQKFERLGKGWGRGKVALDIYLFFR